jgi:hypothetical protein
MPRNVIQPSNKQEGWVQPLPVPPQRFNSMKDSSQITKLSQPGEDYQHSGSFKVNLKNKFKREAKPKHVNSDVNVRKKIKTAGNTNTNALFNSTFGSFSKDPNNTNGKQNMETLTGLDINDPFEMSGPFLDPGIDADTPTLPILENHVEHRDDQPMPQPLPINEHQNDEYSYSQTKSKYSNSLRKKSNQHIQNNIFLITDKNFNKFMDMVSSIFF